MIQRELLKEGTVVLTADKTKSTVKGTDGKYIYFKDGSCYGFRHPDLVEIVEVVEAIEPKDEPAPKAKKSSKKKSEE